MMKMSEKSKELWQLAQEVIHIFNDNGFQAFIVGGALRDVLLQKDIHDIDLATSARPEETEQLFSRTFPVGIRHGTILIRYKGVSFEATTFRKESAYLDFRHPSVVTFTDSILEDLKRRDFTMNALAWGPEEKWIDPYSGRADIALKRLKTVGDPNDRFLEDPLRMLRGLRFISQLGFHAPLSIIRAMKVNARLLTHISVERKWEEMNKLLAGDNLKNAFGCGYITGLFNYLPGFSGAKMEVLKRFPFSSLFLETSDEKWVLFMLILGVKDIGGFCKEWNMPKRTQTKIVKILDTYHFLEKNEWTPFALYKRGLDVAVSSEKIRRVLHESSADSLNSLYTLWRSMPIHNRSELMATGDNLMNWTGLKPGPWINACLLMIEKKIVNGKLPNNREDIRKQVVECQPQKPK